VGIHRFHPTGRVCWKCTYGWTGKEDVPRQAGSSGENAPIDFESATGDVTDAEGRSQPPVPAIRDGDEGESITKPSDGRGAGTGAKTLPARPLTAAEIIALARERSRQCQGN
jgi:hypothetical protein